LSDPGTVREQRSWEPPALASQDSGEGEQAPATPTAEHLEALRQEARQAGYEAGFAEGLATGRARGEALAAEMQTLLQSLTTPLADLDATVLVELLALVERVAVAVLQRELGRQSNIEQVLQQALAVLGEARAEVQLQLHPDDAALCRELGLLPTDQLRVIEDPRLLRGGAHLTASGSFVDASVEQRLEAVMEQLRVDVESAVPLPGEEADG
jgi:flagellar assembly protein FliH